MHYINYNNKQIYTKGRHLMSERFQVPPINIILTLYNDTIQ